MFLFCIFVREFLFRRLKHYFLLVIPIILLYSLLTDKKIDGGIFLHPMPSIYQVKIAETLRNLPITKK